MTRMSERSMQDALYIECSRVRHRLIVPNVQVFGWESDLVSVTANDFIVEYEIKISRKDFKKDVEKYRHQVLRRLRHAPIPGWLPDGRRLGAAYLYYVVTPDIVKLEEVPEHAGLMVVNGMVETIKKAPKLHTTKITSGQRQWLERSLTARFWKGRTHSL
jgi:hypothetical protein